MTKLDPRYNFGAKLKGERPELLRQLDIAYVNTAVFVNRKPDVYTFSAGPPGAGDYLYEDYTIGIDLVAASAGLYVGPSVYMLVYRPTSTTARWVPLG
jgi:hypothetical protein